ncbi:hypothetical protein VR7878_00368 [Vibrio ruber DSM 16370]|uniref:Uncharacterized protein n=1 Tax=Vibrio ruber (strain DSM 16370 / JCM 11486 / BCRC 17186 / CECT 7878 / LMG 23124 / VR1) TaxID=1123498 RepID=A0A1R4LAG7_VIBR1|nr:hypothetical protein [Vibrio ruber]SJN53528.1 hypothetical protein VR7878_00368 [Vibrio ruber DSM 16370]
MSLTEQYNKNGLAKPITIRPTYKMHLCLWGGGIFLLLCSFISAGSDDWILSIFGIPFFGLVLVVAGSAIRKGKDRGLVQFSDSGLWLSTIATTLPWESIGPAWVNRTENEGRATDDVVFIVHNVDQYVVETNWITRLYLKLTKKTLNIKDGGILDFGLEVLFIKADAEDSLDEMQTQLEQARELAGDDPTAVLLNIPVHLG